MSVNPYKHQLCIATDVVITRAVSKLHILPDSFGWFSIAVGEHSSCSAKCHEVNRESSSIGCFRRSTSSSTGPLDRDKSSSSKLLFLKQLNQCCAVQMESTSSLVVLHTLLVAPVALRLRRNSWSNTTRISRRKGFTFSP